MSSTLKRISTITLTFITALIAAIFLTSCAGSASVIGTWPAIGISSEGVDDILYIDEGPAKIEIQPNHECIMTLGDKNRTQFEGTWSKEGTTYIFDMGFLSWSGSVLNIEGGKYLLTTNTTDNNLIIIYALNDKAKHGEPYIADIPDSHKTSTKSHQNKPSTTSSQPSTTSTTSKNTHSTPSGTTSQNRALEEAHDYLDLTGFSRQGLIEQLEYEGFSTSDAEWAADHCNANWNKECAESAESYMRIKSFSRSELREQLDYEGFTSSQIEYGLAAVGL